ncbi:hypothetical protein, partial [Stenotrophomonas sp. UBA7606]|uniref:hypothetical protein n=1 Tax=Stenotrophomonas sp. UBA7606 TaxID=1947559 RepID=UPI0025DD5979
GLADNVPDLMQTALPVLPWVDRESPCRAWLGTTCSRLELRSVPMAILRWAAPAWQSAGEFSEPVGGLIAGLLRSSTAYR